MDSVGAPDQFDRSGTAGAEQAVRPEAVDDQVVADPAHGLWRVWCLGPRSAGFARMVQLPAKHRLARGSGLCRPSRRIRPALCMTPDACADLACRLRRRRARLLPARILSIIAPPRPRVQNSATVERAVEGQTDVINVRPFLRRAGLINRSLPEWVSLGMTT